MTYQATTGAGNYAGTAGAVDKTPFTTLAGLNLIDGVLGGSSTTKSGYVFTGTRVASGTGTPAVFGGYATPVTVSGVTATGTRDFCILTEGVLYQATAAGITLATTATQTGGSAINN